MKTLDFKTQTINPYRRGTRPVWLANWIDRDGVRRTVSLRTRDDTEAREIALDLQKIANDLRFWTMDGHDPVFADFHPVAVQIFFGLDDEPNFSEGYTLQVNLGKDSGVRQKRNMWYAKDGSLLMDVPNKPLDENKREQINDKRTLKQLLREKASWEKERMDLHRALNKHCKATLEEAVTKFKAYYPNGRDEKTVQQVFSVIDIFTAQVGSASMLGELRGPDLNKFVHGYKDKKGNDVKQRTRKKVFRYLSTFWTWAVKQYELIGNPVVHVHKIAGADAEKEIVAIREFKNLTTLLNALKSHPYWRAWIAFATLAGPRFSEQANLKLGNLSDDLTEARIHGKKTETYRRVPIEQNLLMPILRDYIDNIRDKSEESDLLFPSLYCGHGSGKDHVWRSTTFHKHWTGGWNPLRDKKTGKLKKHGTKVVGASEQIQAALKSKADYLSYGPAEWRHCGGTAMGHAGVTELRISMWLGNSAGIARRHYIAPVGATPWPLKYMATEL